MYYFDCHCKYCNLPDKDAIFRSDAARAELSREKPTFREWMEDSTMADDLLIRRNKKDFALAAQEGVEQRHRTQIQTIAMCYALLGDEKNFKKWARKGVQICEHNDSSTAAKYSRWIAEPRSMPLWGTRKAQKMHAVCSIGSADSCSKLTQ
jgi:hypothetical protein